MTAVLFQQVSRYFGAVRAVDSVDLAIAEGEFFAMLGPSGSGKTTCLRLMAGFEQPTAGHIEIFGETAEGVPPYRRNVNTVFQDYALFPHLSILENVAYGLRNRKADRHLRQQRVEQMLALVGLPGSQDKFPGQLSGGQQQRIALARALATSPELLLLDEPLSALDAIERLRLRGEIRSLQSRLGVTTIMVTHDQEEALAMADRIVVMNRGRIQQVGTPDEIYRTPANDFVADFIGRANVLQGEALDSQRLACGRIILRHALDCTPGQALRFYVRPEEIRLLDTLDQSPNSFYAHVVKSEYLGAYSLVTLKPDENHGIELLAQFASNYLDGRRIVPGATLRIAIPADAIRLLPAAS